MQTRIAEELKTAGDDAARASKHNISLNKIVIALTVIGILISTYTAVLSKTDSFDTTKTIVDKADKITTELVEIKSNLSGIAGKPIKQETSRSGNTANPSIPDQRRLESIITAQEQIIRELQKERRQQMEKLKELEQKITGILEERNQVK